MATDIATPLPDITPNEGTVYTVTLDTPAKITQLVVHGEQGESDADLTAPLPGSIYLLPTEVP